MRILKYIFLLIVLGLLALFVYVATKDGKYNISESRTILFKKSTLFDYINDYKNWEDFFVFKSDSNAMKFNYLLNSDDKSIAFNWKSGLNEGEIKSIYIKINDSIAQKATWFGMTSDSNFTFKDTIGGTIVKWNCSGTQDLTGKFISIFYGGIENQLRSNFQESLKKLDAVLTNEINTYNITVEQIEEVNKIYFLKRKSITKNLEFSSKIQQELPIILKFVKENNVPSFGKPFTAFDANVKTNNVVNYAISIPLKEKIYTTQDSEFTIDSLIPHQALKIILKGDYSHRKKAWDKGFEYIQKNNLLENKERKYREVYFISKKDVKNPSKWITEIYIPISPKLIEKPKAKVQNDSI